MFSVMGSLIQLWSCVKVASNLLFRLIVRHVGRMNTQVWLLNSLVRLAEQWTRWLDDGNSTERMMINSIHNVEMPSKMSYLLLISFLCQNRRIAECFLPESQKFIRLELTALTRIAAVAEWLACRTGVTFCEQKRKQRRKRVEREARVRNKNSFSCHVDLIVNQICRFASTKKQKP